MAHQVARLILEARSKLNQYGSLSLSIVVASMQRALLSVLVLNLLLFMVFTCLDCSKTVSSAAGLTHHHKTCRARKARIEQASRTFRDRFDLQETKGESSATQISAKIFRRDPRNIEEDRNWFREALNVSVSNHSPVYIL